MEIKTFENVANIRVLTYKPSGTAVCSVAHDPFSFDLEITIFCSEKLIEYISFEKWFNKKLDEKEYLIEEIADLVGKKLDKVLPEADIEVRIEATTEVHYPVVAIWNNFPGDIPLVGNTKETVQEEK